jgi:UDP-glucose 4-epimerase
LPVAEDTPQEILVTGSSGFVGSRLLKKLREKGEKVITADMEDGIDLTDWNSFSSSLPPVSTVIHLAAKIFVPDSYRDPRAFYTTNIISTLHALEFCRIHKARMIFSSSYVYGVPQSLPIDETAPTSAYNPYAESKLIGEELCRAYNRDFGVEVIIIRPFNIYGGGQKGSMLIPSIIAQAASSEKVMLGDPAPKRDYVHVDDLVDLFIAAKDFKRNESTAVCEVFNACSGSSYSVQEIAEKLLKIIGKNSSMLEFAGSDRKADIADTRGSNKKAGEILGWTPRISLKQGLQECVRNVAP